MHAYRQVQRHGMGVPQFVGIGNQDPLYPPRCMQGAHDVILLGHRRAKEGDEVLPDAPGDAALQALDLVLHQGSRPRQQIRQYLHIDCLG